MNSYPIQLSRKPFAAISLRLALAAAAALWAAAAATSAYAQAAGAGAQFNRTDRAATAQTAELQRLARVDPPIRPDPLGNALLGSPVHGVVRGAAAGVTSIFTGTATGAAFQRARGAAK